MSKPLLALAVCVLSFAAYATSLGNGFVWDDPIILSRQLPAFRSLGALLAPPANLPQFAPDYYRPLVIGSYLLDRELGGGEAWVFHLTVVAAHVLATLAVFLLGEALFAAAPAPGGDGRLAAALGAALFAVHPVHTEAVAWVAGRADVFAALFSTAAVLCHLRARSRPGLAWATAGFVLLALLAKEVAAAVVIVLAALDWLVPDGASAPVAAPAPRAQRRRAAATAPAGRRTTWQRYAPAAAAVAIYAALRSSAIDGGLTTTSGEVQGSWVGRVLGALAVYAGKLTLPVSPNAYIAEVPASVPALGAGVAVLVLLAAGFFVARRRRRQAVAFLLLWIAVTLAPSLAILFKIPEVPIAERYLYLPSVGFCLLCGYAAGVGLADGRRAWRYATAVAVAVALVAGTAATVVRCRVWASDLALWRDTAAKNPLAAMPMRSLGVALYHAGRLQEAEAAYEEALGRRNTPAGFVTLYGNLGSIALVRGDLDRAESYYRSALSTQATADGLYNLAVVSLRRAEAARAAGDEPSAADHARGALDLLRQAEAASPHDPDMQVAAAQALGLLGRGDEARERYQRALALGLSGAGADEVRRLLASP